MTYAKIQPQGILGSGEEDFKGFYHIWAWRPSWSTSQDHFSNLSFPQPKKGSIWNLSKIGPGAPEEKSFEILNIFHIQMHKEAKLT